MDIENDLFKEYKEYITSKVDYKIKVLPKVPQTLSTFPTIIFIESSNAESIQNSSMNGLEYVDLLLYTIEIYTKDIVYKGETIPSREMLQTLKQHTFEFFRQIGFNRMSCNRGEYPDYAVDRLIIIEQGKINNWNKYII